MIDQLDFLIKASETYSVNPSWAAGTRGSSDPIVLGNRLESAVERAALPGSSYLKQLEQTRSLPQPYKFNAVRTVAMGLRDDLIAGWYSSVVELVHADTYSDYLEMAEGLLDQGYKDPAAVITGTSLEVHVRSLCVKHGVDIEMLNGSPKKADTMNADLKKAGVYDGLQQKQITAWMDLRNKAAHGNYADYDQAQVRLFIEGVRAFMMKHPA
jgi:hypothetical protein